MKSMSIFKIATLLQMLGFILLAPRFAYFIGTAFAFVGHRIIDAASRADEMDTEEFKKSAIPYLLCFAVVICLSALFSFFIVMGFSDVDIERRIGFVTKLTGLIATPLFLICI